MIVVYDQKNNKKLTLAVWDLDLTVGSKYLDYYYDGYSSPEYGKLNILNIVTRLENNILTKRYWNAITVFVKHYSLMKTLSIVI